MEKAPETLALDDGTVFWSHTFNTFTATVLVPPPKPELHADILNYGFNAPYLLVFEETPMSVDEKREFAQVTGLAKVAENFASSIVFIYPAAHPTEHTMARGSRKDGAETGWQNADPGIFAEIISNSRIHEYYKDGYVIAKNRFTHKTEGYFIRGAIFRTCLIGSGAAADYIAKNCLKHFEGDGLWGKSDLAPVTCFLMRLSVTPQEVALSSSDIPIVSYGNSAELNTLFKQKCEYFVQRESPDFRADICGFAKQFRRMLGTLEVDPDLQADGLIREPCVVTLKTSSDNAGDDKGTSEHKVGYFAFYNADVAAPQSIAQPAKKVPLVLGFHGGGDSCFFFSTMAGWAKIAHRHGFLLVTVENHLNSTATEMQELIEHLKAKYPVDETRIYATGFSMGGCKTWDFIQEYPLSVAAAAPMDATFEVGLNVYGNPIGAPYSANNPAADRTNSNAPAPNEKQNTCGLNTTVPVPVFYAGGEITPLPELPFQAQKCLDRMRYILTLNGATASYNVTLEEKDSWQNKIWGIDGDTRFTAYDATRGSTLTLELFKNKQGKIWNIFGSISGQGHDCREHTCEHAWRFMRCFSRTADGTILGGDPDEILKSLKE